MPFNSCSPAASKVRPEPETSTSDDPASPATQADVHGDPYELVSGHLTLSRVHAGSYRKTKGPQLIDDRYRASDRAGGAVEGREEAVARRRYAGSSQYTSRCVT